jgi:hypothetical protein
MPITVKQKNPKAHPRPLNTYGNVSIVGPTIAVVK